MVEVQLGLISGLDDAITSPILDEISTFAEATYTALFNNRIFAFTFKPEDEQLLQANNSTWLGLTQPSPLGFS